MLLAGSLTSFSIAVSNHRPATDGSQACQFSVGINGYGMTEHLQNRGIHNRIGIEIGCSQIDLLPWSVQELLKSLNLATAYI
jgi:hypothetical protein